MKYSERYDRNRILTKEQQKELAEKKVLVLGCGGLGGHAVELLGRMGVGNIIASDFDVFTESNLNRQAFSTEKSLGKMKAEVIAKKMSKINSEINVIPVTCSPDIEKVRKMVECVDAVVDGLDTVKDRLILQEICREKQKPLIHGAISGWFGQVSTVMPGNDTLNLIYPEGAEPGDEDGNPSFTPSVVAGIQASEAIKVLLGFEEVLERKLLVIDLLNSEYNVVEL